MAELLEYKCPNCGGNVKFDVTSQQMKCESCDSLFTQKQLSGTNEIPDLSDSQSSYDWQPHGESTQLDGVNGYSCKSCGAQIVADETTVASACPYCGSPVVMMGKVSGMHSPDYVIPFKLDKKAAKAELNKFYKGKWLLPRAFKSGNHLEEMKSVYVPFWLFDCGADAQVVFDATQTRCWSDDEYNYTETSHYNVYRSGTLDFSNIPVDGSSKTDDSYMEGLEPYNFAELTEFNTAYLSGFLADKYDIDANASFPRAKERIENSTSTAIASTVSGYSSVTPCNTCINTHNGFYKYALLPVWMLTSKFNDKKYVYAINGQTGKVAGELPVDKKKLWIISGAIGAVIFALGQFLMF